jgi:L-ascorbate metabolism protein UlaG (beta-lactamase superfamily)
MDERRDVVKITYIRWSMAIIEMDGFTVVTDPVFRFLGLLGIGPPAYTIDQLPQPDLILISHRHFDHWDPWTMRQLCKDIPLVVRPWRIADDARRLGYTDVRELPPWEETRVASITVTATPAVHPGSEVGFVLQGEKTVYFGGDTSFSREDFAEIGKRFELDAALLPIGGLRMLGQSGQLDPAQAVEALKLLHPKTVVGIHWGCAPTLPLLIDMPGTPQELARRVAEAQVNVAVRGMSPLETVEV